MIGYSLYQMHTALNLHFNSTDYDYFKYHGKTRVTIESFKNSPYRWQYGGLERKLEHTLWFMWNQYKANDFTYIPPKQLLYGGNKWLKETKFKHPNDYLSVITKDLDWLGNRYNGSIRIAERGSLYPNMYEDYKEGQISIETLLLVSSHITNVFDLDHSDDVISWPQVVRKMNQLQPFCIDLFDQSTFINTFSNVYLSKDK